MLSMCSNWFFVLLITSSYWITLAVLLRIDPAKSANPTCGVQLFEDRIVGGNATSINDYPWAAIFQYHDEQKKTNTWGCSGAYIGGRTIVTAAHCVDESSRNSLGELKTVRLGEYDTETNPDCVGTEEDKDCNEPPFDTTPEKIIIHPKRSDDTKEYDIAVIIMETKPPYTDFIRPICLPDIAEQDLVDSNEIIYVTGWGWTHGFIRSPSNVKRHVRIQLVQHEICRKQYTTVTVNPNSQLCAGGMSGRNPCRGDSGGPLMRLVDGTYWQLIGVVSFGPSICGRDGVDTNPSVFTKVQYFIPWIVQNAV